MGPRMREETNGNEIPCGTRNDIWLGGSPHARGHGGGACGWGRAVREPPGMGCKESQRGEGRFEGRAYGVRRREGNKILRLRSG